MTTSAAGRKTEAIALLRRDGVYPAEGDVSVILEGDTVHIAHTTSSGQRVCRTYFGFLDPLQIQTRDLARKQFVALLSSALQPVCAALRAKEEEITMADPVPVPITDYAAPLIVAEHANRKIYEALELSKDLDAAESEVRKVVIAMRDVLKYINIQRRRKAP